MDKFTYAARVAYYRLMRKVRAVYDPDPKSLQTAIGLASELAPVIAPLPRGMRREAFSPAGVNCERLFPAAGEEQPWGLLFLHGGAFVFGSPKTHRSMAGYLARELNAQAIVPDYDLSPTFSYPHQLDQVETVFLSCVEEHPQMRWFIAGDSAGGNLALALVHRLDPENLGRLAGLLLFSPWLDLRAESPASVANRADDSLFNADDMFRYAGFYAGEEDTSHPEISPALLDVAHLPPVFLQGARNEFLWPDLEQWFARVEASGVKATFDVEEKAFHSWQLLPGISPAARHSLDRAIAFGREQQAINPLPE